MGDESLESLEQEAAARADGFSTVVQSVVSEQRDSPLAGRNEGTSTEKVRTMILAMISNSNSNINSSSSSDFCRRHSMDVLLAALVEACMQPWAAIDIVTTLLTTELFESVILSTSNELNGDKNGGSSISHSQ